MWVVVWLLGCTSPADSGAPWTEVDAAHAAELQAAMEGARAEQDLPGLAMAVAYRDSRTLWVGTTGYADLDTEAPWERDATFRIGSVSKTLTAAAVFRLAERGVLDLDDPIEQWVPGYWEGPTLRQLLAHSSGIASYNYIGSFDSSQAWTPTELVEWAWEVEPALRFEPGSDWEYSNTNYVLLGLVIEAATGDSYGAHVTAELVDPLQLAATRLAETGDSDPAMVRSYSEAPPQDISDVDDPSMGWSAGGWVSTPEDLARWTVALYGEDVLSEASHTLMVTPLGLTGPDESDYGIGAFVESDGELTITGHTGGIAGYATYAYFLDDPPAALVVMANQRGTDLRAASTWGWAAILGIEYDGG